MASRIDNHPRRRATDAPGTGPDRILTVQEVAEVLRVPVSWVYDRVRRAGPEGLPHMKLGKYLRFHASALQDWLKSQSAS